jgi:hypothetical protein
MRGRKSGGAVASGGGQVGRGFAGLYKRGEPGCKKAKEISLANVLRVVENHHT